MKRSFIPAAALVFFAANAALDAAAQEQTDFSNEKRILQECDLQQKTLETAAGKLNYCQGFYNASEPGAPAVLVFLHGVGERGSENLAQNRLAVPEIVRNIRKNRRKVVLLTVQCPLDQVWAPLHRDRKDSAMREHPQSALSMVPDLVRAKVKEFNADPSRLYVTGLSMGGFGTWDLISRNPDLFAAAIPICGGGDPEQTKTLKDMPIWIFHGDADALVPVQLSRTMFEELKRAGSQKVRYTEFPGVEHNSWDKAYAMPETLDWLFQQKKECAPAE